MPGHSNPGCKTRSLCLPPPPRVAAVLRASEGHGSPVLARTSCGASQTLNSVSGLQHPTHRITVNTPSHAGQHRQRSSHPPPDQQKLWVNGVRYPMGSALVFCPWHYRTTACHLQASAPLLAGGLLPFITAAFRVASTQLGGEEKSSVCTTVPCMPSHHQAALPATPEVLVQQLLPPKAAAEQGLKPRPPPLPMSWGHPTAGGLGTPQLQGAASRASCRGTPILLSHVPISAVLSGHGVGAPKILWWSPSSPQAGKNQSRTEP